MDLPLGVPLQQSLKTANVDMLNTILELMKKQFTGYIVVTINGYDGIEEGAILFRKGVIIGAGYEFMKYGVTIEGNDAFKIVLNAFKAKHGVIDIYSLTTQHMDLLTAFHEKMLISLKIEPKNLKKIYPREFSDRYAKDVIKQQEEVTKYDIFKRAGIAGITER